VRWRARSSAAARPPPFNRRCAALCSRRGFIVASWIHCCKNVTARCAGSHFALRAQVVRRCAAPSSRCCARSPCSPLRGSRASIVQRCCAALLARFAGRGRWSVAVATLVPAARVFARSRRCCGSPSGSRSRLHPRPYSAQSLNPKPILKLKRSNTPHPPKMEKGVPESTL